MGNPLNQKDSSDKMPTRQNKAKKSSEEKKALRSQRREERKRKRRNYRVYKKDIKKQSRRIKVRQVRTYILLLLKMLLVSLVIGLVGGGAYLYNNYGHLIFDAYKDARDKTETLDMGIFTDREPTEIYDKDGNLLRELAVHDFEYIEIDDIQDSIKLATIAIEDERYLEHDGVDLKAIARAGYTLVQNNGEITQGGSTITQQLVKNNILTFDQTYSRKLTEVFIAYELEKQLTKKQILEYYLNNIYFGHGAYGIESASNYYFSKPSQDLTLAEATFLMAIPNNPSLYDPFDRPENTEKRQARILQKMFEQNFITHEEFTEASLQDIQLKVTERVYEPETYLVSYAISDATKKLMQAEGFIFKYDFTSDEERSEYNKIYSESFTRHNQAIRKGGYIIHTSLDQKMQTTVQDIVNKEMSYSTTKDGKSGLYKRQATSVVLDNKTGMVQAIVGGRTQVDVANTYNRAFLARRQPGSTIKPLLVYTPLFERSHTKDSVVVDEPVKNGPKNVTGSYIGKTTVEKAVINSINTIPFKMIQQIGVPTSLSYLKEMEFSGIVDADNNPTSAIGGMTYGATTLEMAGAFSTLARNGEFMDSTSTKSIHDASNGTLIYEWKPETKKVYDAGASYMMTEVLEKTAENTNFTDGRNGKLQGYATAVKTGTTNNVKDVWYAGYTPYYTMVVWVGEDTPKQMQGKTSYDDPLDIWTTTMKQIHKGLPEKPHFDKPTNALKTVWIKGSNGRLSDIARTGWKKAEVPMSRWNKQVEEDRKAEELRQKKLEEERKAKEEAERLRLEEEERRAEEKRKQEEELNNFLKTKGTSLNEEKQKLSDAEYYLNALANFYLSNDSQYARAEGYIQEVQTAIDKLIYIDYKNDMQGKLQEQIVRIDNQKDLIEKDKIYREYRQQQDTNRIKENEIKQQERERLQKELAQKAQKEKERLEREQEEQDRLDAEANKLLEEGEENTDQQPESDNTEPTTTPNP